MGMILYLQRISDADIAQVAMLAGARAFVEAWQEEPDRGPEYAAARAELMRQMIAEGYVPPPKAAVTFGTYPFNDIFDVDKLWNGLYFLLTGTAGEGEPPVNYLFGSPPASDEDVGYGPALAISAARTKELSDHLDGLSKSEVLARFDGPRMAALNIYPDIWDEDPDELKQALGDAYDALKAYCRRCADHGLGMLCYIS